MLHGMEPRAAKSRDWGQKIFVPCPSKYFPIAPVRQAALVTGGAVRLGRGLALSLARQGQDIALHYHSSREEAERVRREISDLGVRCAVFQADLSGPPGVEALLIKRAAREFPELSTLVNSASVYESGTLGELSGAALHRQIRVNAEAPILLTQAFALTVAGGHVVNILDNKIAFAQYQYTAYLLSKKMLAEFTKMAALELAPRIRVNGIAPGVVLPAESRSEEYLRWRVEGIPLKRQGSPDEIGEALRFLCQNQFVTGQILFVDGGESLGSAGRNAPAFPGEGG